MAYLHLKKKNKNSKVFVVHRLDKDTSGILLVAKTNEAHRILCDDFKNKNVKRKYQLYTQYLN